MKLSTTAALAIGIALSGCGGGEVKDCPEADQVILDAQAIVGQARTQTVEGVAETYMGFGIQYVPLFDDINWLPRPDISSATHGDDKGKYSQAGMSNDGDSTLLVNDEGTDPNSFELTAPRLINAVNATVSPDATQLTAQHLTLDVIKGTLNPEFNEEISKECGKKPGIADKIKAIANDIRHVFFPNS